MDDEGFARQVYRLAWKWRGTGARGSGPWVRDLDRVRALLDSLSARVGTRAEHWVEVAPAQRYVEGPTPTDTNIERLSDSATSHNGLVL